MRNKKKTGSGKTPEQEALERRVDAMMDPKKPDETPATAVSSTASEKTAAKAPGTAKGAKTAPQLSAKLRKQAGIADVSTKTLSIDKSDELAESIAEPETPDESDGPEAPEADSGGPPQNNITEQTDLDDSRTDEAVDDIVSYEGDVMLAIADSTAAERNRQASLTSNQKDTNHPFATFFWFLVIIIVIVAIVLGVLLVTGGNLPGPLKQ